MGELLGKRDTRLFYVGSSRAEGELIYIYLLSSAHPA